MVERKENEAAIRVEQTVSKLKEVEQLVVDANKKAEMIKNEMGEKQKEVTQKQEALEKEKNEIKGKNELAKIKNQDLEQQIKEATAKLRDTASSVRMQMQQAASSA